MYLRLLIFLLTILIPSCASSSLAFCMMYSAYKLNKQGDNISLNVFGCSWLSMLWWTQLNSEGTQPCMYPFSPQIPLPSRLSHNIEQSPMCYTVGPCWLSILNIEVCNFFIFVWEESGHTHTYSHTQRWSSILHAFLISDPQLAGGKGQVSWPKYAACNILYTSASNHHGPHQCISQLYAKLRRQ